MEQRIVGLNKSNFWQKIKKTTYLFVSATLIYVLTSCSHPEDKLKTFFYENKDTFLLLSNENYPENVSLDFNKNPIDLAENLFLKPSKNYKDFFMKVKNKFPFFYAKNYCTKGIYSLKKCGLLILLERNQEESIMYGYFIFSGDINKTNGDFVLSRSDIYIDNNSINIVENLEKNIYFSFGRGI